MASLDADALRRWAQVGLDTMRRAREEIDALNVYPVPDGDTGTNLALTMESVVASVPGAGAGLGEVAAAIAKGALLGARGNSGVILSQLLRGVADTFKTVGSAGGRDVKQALSRAADLAYTAVEKPVEGTMLTVARAAAEAADQASADDVGEVLSAAARGAAEALARTPDQLPALRAAGVVDAGGKGLVVLLDALVSVVTGAAPQPQAQRAPVVSRDALTAAREAGSSEYGYEVQYLLDAADEDIPGLRERLAGLGDSLVVVGGDGLWTVHVHVNDIGAAIEAGIDIGRPHRITVTRFADQYTESRAADEERIVLAVAPGPLARLFRSAGAITVEGGPTSNPATRELLTAIREAGARELAILPNDGNVRAVADSAAELARADGYSVAVIPTQSAVQGLAALAVHDTTRPFDDDVIAMTSAAGATRWAEVTTAARDTRDVHKGDVIGLMGGELALSGSSVFEVACGLLDRMLIGGGELVTVVTGAGADADLGRRLADYLAAVRPDVDVSLHVGGQPHYPVLLGVE